MILSNIEIHKALDDGDIVINPEPLPRFVSIQEPNCPYDTTAVNLRLSPALGVCDKQHPIAFDLRTKGLPELLKQIYRPVTIPDAGYVLAPGLFVLGNTVENVHLPIREGRATVAARVEGRSSFARCGLLVHFTAPTIHAGFEGTITLEIMNFGKHPILLFPDLHIAQLIFERVDGIPKKTAKGQFQGQRTPAGTST